MTSGQPPPWTHWFLVEYGTIVNDPRANHSGELIQVQIPKGVQYGSFGEND